MYGSSLRALRCSVRIPVLLRGDLLWVAASRGFFFKLEPFFGVLGFLALSFFLVVGNWVRRAFWVEGNFQRIVTVIVGSMGRIESQ